MQRHLSVYDPGTLLKHGLADTLEMLHCSGLTLGQGALCVNLLPHLVVFQGDGSTLFLFLISEIHPHDLLSQLILYVIVMPFVTLYTGCF